MTARPGPAERSRAQRLRSPLLIALWVLLGFEAVGGLVIFTAFLVAGVRPGETLHVLAGALTTGLYAVYQWRHWKRVTPIRLRLDYVLGIISATVMALALLSGFALAVPWWMARVAAPHPGEVAYPSWLSAFHNIGGMLILAFVGAHLGAVLMRDRPRTRGDVTDPRMPTRSHAAGTDER